MALPKGMTLTQEKVSQKFDLEEIFGVDFSSRPDLKQEIAQAIIDKMIDRTSKGEGRGGVSLASYSASYRDSKVYDQYGKDGTVNMELTGAMLDSMDLIDESQNTIEIGFDNPKENAKAYGHLTGMQGHKFLQGKVPKRPFFGLTRSEIDEISAEFEDDIVNILDETTENRQLDLMSIAALNQGTPLPSPKVIDFSLDIFGGLDEN